MLKKMDDYLTFLMTLLAAGKPLTERELHSVQIHIAFFQHERLTHELVMILFAMLSVGGILFFSVYPEIPVFCLDVLFFALLVPYIKHYYGLENRVQHLYDVYDQLENL